MKKATENEAGLYRAFSVVEPPQGLYARIMTRIELARRRQAQVRTGFFALLAFVSGALLLPILQYTAGQLYASGFNDYLTLALSDRSAVMYWRELGLSLIESLPWVALLLLLPIAAALVWSLIRLVKSVRSAFIFARPI